MALNGTMVKIDSVTVGSGGATEIVFSNIPQTYTDLKLVTSLRGTGDLTAAYIDGIVTFNGTTTNYSERMVYGLNGTTASSVSQSDAGLKWATFINEKDTTASTFSNNEMYIPNYTGSTNKSVSLDSVVENNASASIVALSAGLWSNTAAITSIKIAPATGNFAQHSTATLYGISRTTSQIKATGGTVYDDADYVYHLFASSGTFTPTQALTCDVLVVAGGGGGGRQDGNNAAGGGGAGGYRYLTSQALSATGYTVTVGAGGAGGASNYNAGTSGNNSVFSSTTSTGGGGGHGNGIGLSGGSGGGSSYSYTTGGSASPSGEGNAGGGAGSNSAYRSGGGGGGAGAVGGTGTASVNGAGGNGLNTLSAWATATSTGSSGYYAGGGGASAGSIGTVPAATGGLGGGGTGGAVGGAAVSGTTNTGGGGGASSNGASGSGGSGIVIVRYAK